MGLAVFFLKLAPSQFTPLEIFKKNINIICVENLHGKSIRGAGRPCRNCVSVRVISEDFMANINMISVRPSRTELKIRDLVEGKAQSSSWFEQVSIVRVLVEHDRQFRSRFYLPKFARWLNTVSGRLFAFQPWSVPFKHRHWRIL